MTFLGIVFVMLLGIQDGRSLVESVHEHVDEQYIVDLQCIIWSTASGSSSLRSIVPDSASRNGLLQAPSKNPDREHMIAL